MILPRRTHLCVLGWLLAATSGGGADVLAGQLKWEKLPAIPNRLGLGGPYAGVSGGKLLVGGGANFPEGMPWAGGKKKWYDTVYALTESQAEWKEAGKLLRPMGYGVSVTAREGVVCAGGSDLQRHYREVFVLRLDGSGLETRPLPMLPRPMANGCGAIMGDVVYVAGGIDEPAATAALRTFWALDLGEKTPVWRELEPWPGAGRMLAVAAVADGAFYLISGTSLSSDTAGKPARRYLTDVYRYRPRTGWQRMADIPRAAVAAPSPAPVVAATQVLVLSGDDGTKVDFQPPEQHPGFPQDVLAYDTKTDTWKVVGKVPVTQVTVPTALWDGRYVIPNGEIRPGVRTPEVWSFSSSQVPGDRQSAGP